MAGRASVVQLANPTNVSNRKGYIVSQTMNAYLQRKTSLEVGFDPQATRPWHGDPRRQGLCSHFDSFPLWGRFAQRGHSAGTVPIITVFVPGTPLKTTHL